MRKTKKGDDFLETAKDYYRLFFASSAILLTILAQLLIPKSAVSFTKIQSWYLYFLWISFALSLAAAFLVLYATKKENFITKAILLVPATWHWPFIILSLKS